MSPIRRLSVLLTIIVVALSGLTAAQTSDAQQLDVTFRYFPPLNVGERAFLPGEFNNWGQPYISGTSCIQPGNVSEMTLNSEDRTTRLVVPLDIGSTVEYKIQLHLSVDGTECEWFSDPLNPDVIGPNSNSVLTVTDPLIFQPAEELALDGRIDAFSVGLFSSEEITSVEYSVNGAPAVDGLEFLDDASGIFRVELGGDLRSGSLLKLVMEDAGGRRDSVSIGEIQPPILWLTEPFKTVMTEYELVADITDLTGEVDPSITEAVLLRNGVELGTVDVVNGVMQTTVDLERGDNTYTLQVDYDGLVLTSDPLTITNRLSPLDHVFFTSDVSGSGFEFAVSLTETDVPVGELTYEWTLDETASTTTVTGLQAPGPQASGTADGPGELYFDVIATSADDEDYARIGVVIEEDGTARAPAYDETAAWIDEAVVYEIFALQFGPTATGTSSIPGDRFQEITDELDYIAGMGFNTIWFMPIMRSRNQTPIGAGYDMIDFFNVDPKLGTNEDFKALIERAHELGIKVIIDWTPNHTAPNHPWAESLAEGGAYSDWYQKEINPHTSGLDGRGANLPEAIQPHGVSQYVRYEGFGDLANLNWDNPDLRATMLDVVEHWAREFDIDGWRLDVYWGPWRKYGPEAFGTPLRQAFRRVRPDGWLLGEINGTSAGTEVYYADDENGNSFVGGLDAGYDWPFHFNAVRSSYNVDTYHDFAFNGGFWPGPNARYFRFIENHDEERIAKHFANPLRIRVATSFLMTTTGIPMIYAGQEVNYGGGSGDTRRTPVDWNTQRNGEFAELHQWLAHVRTGFPAFTTQAMTRIPTGSASVYGVVRPYPDENAVVLINYAGVDQTVTLDPSDVVDWSTDGPIPYHDIRQDTSNAYLGSFNVRIPAYETVVYITGDDVEFTVPDLPDLPYGAVYTSDERTTELPAESVIRDVWPNPVRTEATIEFTLPEPGRVTLSAFDLLGRRVAVIQDGMMSAGSHQAFWTPESAPAGVYLIRLDTPGRSATRTVVRVR